MELHNGHNLFYSEIYINVCIYFEVLFIKRLHFHDHTVRTDRIFVVEESRELQAGGKFLA